MLTQKELAKDLTAVAGGARFLTAEQIARYTGYGKDTIARMFAEYGVTYIGEAKARRYEVSSVAECIFKKQRTRNGIGANSRALI